MAEEARPKAPGIPQGDDGWPAGNDVQGDSGVTACIGGVDLREMQAAHRQHPILSRWEQTSIKLIPDIYDLVEQANAIIAALQQRNSELEDRIKELEPETGKGDGGSDDPAATLPAESD